MEPSARPASLVAAALLLLTLAVRATSGGQLAAHSRQPVSARALATGSLSPTSVLGLHHQFINYGHHQTRHGGLDTAARALQQVPAGPSKRSLRSRSRRLHSRARSMRRLASGPRSLARRVRSIQLPQVATSRQPACTSSPAIQSSSSDDLASNAQRLGLNRLERQGLLIDGQDLAADRRQSDLKKLKKDQFSVELGPLTSNLETSNEELDSRLDAGQLGREKALVAFGDQPEGLQPEWPPQQLLSKAAKVTETDPKGAEALPKVVPKQRVNGSDAAKQQQQVTPQAEWKEEPELQAMLSEGRVRPPSSGNQLTVPAKQVAPAPAHSKGRSGERTNQATSELGKLEGLREVAAKSAPEANRKAAAPTSSSARSELPGTERFKSGVIGGLAGAKKAKAKRPEKPSWEDRLEKAVEKVDPAAGKVAHPLPVDTKHKPSLAIEKSAKAAAKTEPLAEAADTAWESKSKLKPAVGKLSKPLGAGHYQEEQEESGAGPASDAQQAGAETAEWQRPEPETEPKINGSRPARPVGGQEDPKEAPEVGGAALTSLPKAPVAETVKSKLPVKPVAQSRPLYESPALKSLPGKCRLRLRDLTKAIGRLLQLVESVSRKLLLAESVSFMTRDVLERRLRKIRTAGEQARLAANLGSLQLVNEEAKTAGLELIRLANSQVAVRLEPSLRPFAPKLRRVYGLYRKSCKGIHL